MKKFTLLLAAMVVTGLVASASPVIYGYQTWQYGVASPVRGPVKMDPSNPAGLTLIADQSTLGVCYGAVYHNYKWYAQGVAAGTQTTVEGIYEIDPATGERTLLVQGGSKLIDMTYDYSSGVIYGVRSGNQILATMDLATGTVEAIDYLGSTDGTALHMLAIAASKDGTLYGVAADDSLYVINKQTAVCTTVGALGVNAAYDQSMEFDHNTGTLYWANNGDYSLYTIDVTTGKATRLGGFGPDSNCSMAGIYVPYINVAAGAPDRVTSRQAVAEGTTVALSWVNPSTDAQGNALTALDGVKIYRDGEYYAAVSFTAADAGQAGTYVDNEVAAGLHTYSFIPYNDKGDGGVDNDPVSVMVGENAPGAVGNLTVVAGDNNATISWTAPTEGMYGGQYDPTGVTKYEITRAGSSTATIVVDDPSQTTYTDEPGFGTYTYTVAAYNAVGKGTETTSASVLVKPSDWIVMGQGATAVVEDGKTYKFYDHAGQGYYSNLRNDTITLVPAAASRYVNVKFTQFSMDTYGDSLKIYNGSSTAAPLIGSYSATSVPVALESVSGYNSTGALTFVFNSDVMGRDNGWTADVTSQVQLANDLELVSATGEGYPTAGDETTYNVTVFNKGANAASGYKVVLLNDGDVIAQVEGPELATYEETELAIKYTPAAEGSLVVTARIDYAADGDLTNNTSDPIAQTVVAAGSKYVSIATENAVAIYVLPTSFSANDAMGETIYPASLINVSGDYALEMLSFPYHTVTSEYKSVPLQVWVGETESDNISSSSIPASELTQVFDGTIDVVTGDTEMVIPCTTKYKYKGGNLVMLMRKASTNAYGGGVTFKGTYGNYLTDAQCSRFASIWGEGDGTHYDANENFGYAGSTQRADVNLLFVSASTGVNSVAGTKAVIAAVDGGISVAGNGGNAVAVYTIDGRLAMSAASVDTAVLPVAAGIYVVKAGNTVAKVVVK